MTYVHETTKPGYFNALTAGAFKRTADGRRLFYPWGVLGRGYEIPTEEAYQRLHRQMRLYLITSLVLVITPMVAHYTLVGIGICALLMGSFAIWNHYQMRGMKLADERLTFRESITIQARTHRPAVLWALLIAALVFVITGAAILVMDPKQWLIGVLAIVFFGPCAAMFAWMLNIRRRAPAQP